MSRSEEFKSLWQEGFTFRISLGTGPACTHKCNLVDEICNVVDHIQVRIVHGSKQVAEQVASRIDGPTKCDNHAHVAQGRRHGAAAVFSSAAGFPNEDLCQNEEPATQATDEGRPCREDCDLAKVSEQEHHNGADQELPEHSSAGWLAGTLEDQVELNHLQRDGDAPVYVSVDDGRAFHHDPVLTHVHVMHTCHQSDQTTHVQRCLPVALDSCCLCEEEHGCRHHCNGDNPERNGYPIIWLQESVLWVVHGLNA